ncbi:MAG: hypothetical protein R3C03_21195 [Pirellulaceae bacterium]
MHQARNGIQNNLQPSSVRAFVQAWRREREMAFNIAYSMYSAIVQDETIPVSEQYVVAESQKAVTRLELLRQLPEGPDGLTQWIKSSNGIENEDGLIELIDILDHLIEMVAANPDYVSVAEDARDRRSGAQKKLVELAEKKKKESEQAPKSNT